MFQRKHILLVLVAISFALSGCQNRKTGIFGADNWQNGGYGRNFLTSPPVFAPQGSQVIGYLVYNQGFNQLGVGQGRAFNPPTGRTGPGNNQGSGNGAGRFPTGSGVGGAGTPCLLKIAAVSSQNYAVGSNQSFGGVYNESAMPSSGRGVYQTGVKFPVTCGRDSEVASTGNAFYITGGSTGDKLYVYRMDPNGNPRGFHDPLIIGPSTKIAASPTGHVAVVTNGGRDLTLIYEDRVGGDGGAIADVYHSIPAQNGALYVDVAIDYVQRILYTVQKQGGATQVLIYDLEDAFNGVFNPAAINQQTIHNFMYNLPNESKVDVLFRSYAPISIKTNNGLTGIFTAMGRPSIFLESWLDEGDKHTIDNFRAFDPFQNFQGGSQFVQPKFQYKDFAVGKNMMYLITDQGNLYTSYVSSEYPIDASTPWETRLNLGMRINTIEMSFDNQYAIVTGSRGLSVGRVAGSNLIFSANGRPDVEETGEVISAAGFAKISKVVAPQKTADVPATTDAAKKQ